LLLFKQKNLHVEKHISKAYPQFALRINALREKRRE